MCAVKAASQISGWLLKTLVSYTKHDLNYDRRKQHQWDVKKQPDTQGKLGESEVFEQDQMEAEKDKRSDLH